MKARLINYFVYLNLRSGVTRGPTWLFRFGFYYPAVEPWGWNTNSVETVAADMDEVSLGPNVSWSIHLLIFVSKPPKYNQISLSNLVTGIPSFSHSWKPFFSDWQVQQTYSGVAAHEAKDRAVVETTQPNMVSDSRVHNSRTLMGFKCWGMPAMVASLLEVPHRLAVVHRMSVASLA